MSSRHWGEIPNEPEPLPLDISDVIQRAMNGGPLPDLESLEDGLPDDEMTVPVAPVVGSPIVLQPPDSLVIYAISLHKYMYHMSEIIRVAQLAIDGNIMPCKEAAPPIPQPPEIFVKHKPNFLNFIPKEDTDFTLGKEVEIPVLSDTIVREVLKKSVCTLLAHIGYETTQESIVIILVDVLKQFYQVLCKKLENAINDEEKHGSAGFPNVIERVLIDMGMGGVKGLHDYYQSRVIKYIKVLYGRATELSEAYNNLLITKNPSTPESGRLISVKMEKEETEENPEVHLLDGEIEFASLESGFQLLNSLEAETK
ncbi:hypothetical protein WA026_011631 [Henosepilachna vigintioctopunctata]|uniref:STAGA complex 65 subunit gamma n=1 Tax=Henosepilachna vigintioctopunctata TaxID=420089 RepID=A0AAW1TJV9_9CUCU